MFLGPGGKGGLDFCLKIPSSPKEETILPAWGFLPEKGKVSGEQCGNYSFRVFLAPGKVRGREYFCPGRIFA